MLCSSKNPTHCITFYSWVLWHDSILVALIGVLIDIAPLPQHAPSSAPDASLLDPGILALCTHWLLLLEHEECCSRSANTVHSFVCQY